MERQRRKTPPNNGRHTPGLDLLSWTAVYRRSLKPGVYFDLVSYPYQADIYACAAKVMVVMKCAQEGVSEYAVSYALHGCDQRKATVLYVFPTDTAVSDFSSARIGPAIEASNYLSSIVVDGGGRDKSGADRIKLKRIRDNFLYLRGGHVKPNGKAPQLKSVDADIIILDEWDEMDSRAPSIARKRLGGSLIAEERAISTPTYVGRGVHAEYQKSDGREWHIRCEHCGQRQPVTIKHIIVEWDQLERPVAWHGMKEGRAFAACEKCGKELNRLGQGEWVAARPNSKVAGFHLSKLFSPTGDLSAIVESLKEVDETKRRETYNQDLGLPYKPRGANITDTVLDNCRRNYAHGPVKGERTFMGVDVGRVMHVVIRAPYNSDGERPQRFAGTVDSFDEVGRLIRQYNVYTCVIDALPETRMARGLQASFADGTVWLAYYTGSDQGTKKQEPAEWNSREGVVNLDRTRMLDTTLARFIGGAPENILPANAADIPDYYDQLKAPVRQLEGNVAKYVESGPDHYAHAENYCTAAAMRESWSMW